MKLFSMAVFGFLSCNFAFAGGVSGGGGNTKPTEPLATWQIESEIKFSRQYVAWFFNSQEFWFQYGKKTPLEMKLFAGTQTVIDRILAVPVHIEKEGPCFDPAGNPMDGSAVSSEPQSICVSVPRLQDKLSADNLRTQTLALVAHEYSHLVGATEEEANALQEEAIQKFKEGDFHRIDRELKDAFMDIYWRVGKPDMGIPDLSQLSWEEIHEHYGYFVEGFRKTFTPPGSGRFDFYLWQKNLLSQSYVTEARLDLFFRATCSLAKAENCKSLDEVFLGANEVDYDTYMLRTGHWAGNFESHPGVILSKVTDYPTAQSELNQIFVDLRAAQAYLTNLTGMN